MSHIVEIRKLFVNSESLALFVLYIGMSTSTWVNGKSSISPNCHKESLTCDILNTNIYYPFKNLQPILVFFCFDNLSNVQSMGETEREEKSMFGMT